MIFKFKDANYDFGALISNKGFVMVDISEQSLVSLLLSEEEACTYFQDISNRENVFEFANIAPNVVVEKVSFQEFHQMHQN